MNHWSLTHVLGTSSASPRVFTSVSFDSMTPGKGSPPDFRLIKLSRVKLPALPRSRIPQYGEALVEAWEDPTRGDEAKNTRSL